MSSACRNKDAAWDFLRQMIKQHYNISNVHEPGTNISINLRDYELLIEAEIKWIDEILSNDSLYKFYTTILPWDHFSVPAPQIFRDLMTEEDVQQYRTLINTTDQLYWPDDDLADIVWESIGPYLAGDRDLDDTVALLNNRTTLYLNELR